IEGRPPDERDYASFDCVGPHYFETIGTPLVRGRLIGDEDTPTSEKVAAINQAFAKKFFPKQDPIGQHFGMRDPKNAGDMELVGTVEDAIYQNARDPAYPTLSMPYLHLSEGHNFTVVPGAVALVGRA